MNASMQTKMLAAIEKVADKHEVEVVHQPQWANTGTLFLQRDWDTLLVITYQFNDTYASIRVSGSRAQGVKTRLGDTDVPGSYWISEDKRSGGGFSLPHCEYTIGARIVAFLDLLDELLN